jgi:hypothetical protein
MSGFAEVFSALQNGKQIRRNKWDATTKMFIDQRGELMQQASGKPYVYQLNGAELTAKDWAII